MPNTTFKGRKAVTIENDQLRVTVMREGGHLAELLDKRSGVNPLWSPPWTSIDHSAYSPSKHPEYGGGGDARLLAGILGHNLCLDIFGGPSPEEQAAGVDPHGEGSRVAYDIESDSSTLVMRADFPLAQIRFSRRLELHGANLRFLETVQSLAAFDRPIGWTQHVTLSPPFIEPGATQVRCSAGLSKVFDGEFSAADYLQTGAEFTWPKAPRKDGGVHDLRLYSNAKVSGGYTAHLMTQQLHAFFTVFSPSTKVAVGYVWRQQDFPWMGIWEENCSRVAPPWNSKAITLAMEFGVSPFPETRREMVDRGKLFGAPTYRWLPAMATLEAEYWATVRSGETVPETLTWPGVS